jgi:hypothetical protein
MSSRYQAIMIVMAFACLCAQQGAQEIYYTGKLFGYYRIEYGESTHLPPVERFLDWRKDAPGWLLGMGDNFGPEFGASIQLKLVNENDNDQGQENGCASPSLPERGLEPPQTLYKDADRIAKLAQYDNVMNFLMQAGYRAVMPGREDFIYSAAWLACMAAEVRDTNAPSSIHNSDQRLELLAANLRLTSGADAGGASGRKCPLLFAQDPLGKDATPCTADGSAPTTFDWVDRLDKATEEDTRNAILNALAYEKAQNSKGKAPSLHPVRDTTIANEFLILKAAWVSRCTFNLPDPFDPTRPETMGETPCRQEANAAPQSGVEGRQSKSGGRKQKSQTANPRVREPLSGDESKDLNTYWTDLRNRLLVAFASDSKQQTAAREALQAECSATSSAPCETDLLISADAARAARRQLLRNIDGELFETGYTIAGDSDDGLLIVGVVGKETMSAISQTNLRVCFDANAIAKCKGETPKDAWNVEVFDPVSAVEMSIRAAMTAPRKFKRVIVMAQMPAPEAEVLAARVRMRIHDLNCREGYGAGCLESMTPDSQETRVPAVDLILSEAQTDYESSNMALEDVQTDRMTPVFAPPAPDFSDPERMVMAGSVARVTFDAALRKYRNQREFTARFPYRDDRATTTSELTGLMNSSHSGGVPCLNTLPRSHDCGYQSILAVLDSMQRARPSSDVVMFERRDLYTGPIPRGYGGGADDKVYCQGASKLQECLLRVALDRVFWKGDYVERLAVTGADLAKIVQASTAEAAGESDLKVTDLAQQWLVTYGVTQPSLSNLTRLSTAKDPLWIPADPECKQASQSASAKSVYCVNGAPLADDQIYWVTTNDALAEDSTIYPQLGAVSSHARKISGEFQTRASAIALEGFERRTEPAVTDEGAIETLNRNFQQQRLFHVDFNKMVLGFNSNRALGPTDQVPSELQGVADSRAAVPHSQDVDLEALLRLTADHGYKIVTFGTQTSFAYERSIKGNLSGSPESISYAQNNAAFGAFAQVRLRRDSGISSRALPRELLVLTPHQFQTQINNQRLFIAFTAKDPTTGQTIPGQLAVPVPIVDGFNDRLGYRHEWGYRKPGGWNFLSMDSGSYAESGFEYSLQNNILESVTLANGVTQHTCVATAQTDIASCFKNLKSTFPIGPGTGIVGRPPTETIHTPGAYWDVHLSRGFDMGSLKSLKPPFALVSDSTGDWYFGRPPAAELPTQTEYAVAWSSSIDFPVWGNLALGPTYTVFFYQPQLSSVHEQIRSFSISLRWYAARDQRVPLGMIPGLTGPQSADQTKAAGKSK